MARINLDEGGKTAPATPLSGEIVPEEKKPEMPKVKDGGAALEIREKTSSSIFSSFLSSPVDVSFGEAEEGEKIVLLLRAHWVTNFPWILAVAALIIGPIILTPLFSAIGFSGIAGRTTFVLVCFWYLATATYAFLNFLYWYFNVYLVTTLRIIDIDWYSVVVRKVSSMPLSRVQDISATQIGALSGIFDFGNVSIQTAAEEENFEFVNVPHPQLAAKQIDILTHEKT